MSDPARLGKYVIESVLGKGAMGVVYKAHDPDIDRTVAIKTVRKDLVDPDVAAQFMARFRNEARAAGRLHHPNIIGIYEYGEENEIAYIAMEYVDGRGLREYLNRKTRFALPQLVAIMSQLLHALEFAHARGVVHRDIKPANLIMTADGTLKVADFGIARIDTSSLTMTGMVMGTPSYMSPEQCQGRTLDHRSDLFSAGVVLYELLTGEKPFGGSMESISHRICYQDPLPPSQVTTMPLPSALDAVLAKALAKSPDDRFQQARDFQSALRQAMGDLATASTDATVLHLPDTGTHAPDTATWDDTVLTTVEKQLAQLVGPLARIMVRQAAPRAHDVHELYALLADSIQDPVKRRAFVTNPAIASGSGPHPRSSTQPGVAGMRTATRASDAPVKTRATTPRPLEPAFVEHITGRLAVYLGPIAKVVSRKAAQQARDGDEFVRIVASHLGTQERRAFLLEVGVDDV